MNRRELRNEVQSVVIKTPCSVSWKDMDGDEMVRFCGQCQKKVHNLSTLPDKEIAKVLANGRIQPTCVIMRKRADGTVIFDNCPVFLRSTRDRFFATVVTGLLVLAWGLVYSVNVPSADPLTAQLIDMSRLYEISYDRARDISRIVTAASVVVVLCLGLFTGKKNAKQAIIEWLTLAAIPFIVHLIGTFITNNYGGLGGGGI